MKIILNERGMSLVQVVIAAGMMSMLGLFMMRMQENQSKTQNDIEAKAEMLSFMQKFSSLMATPGYCEKNLKGIKIGRESGISLDKFIAPNGRVVFKVGEVYGDRQIILKSIEQKEFFFDDEEETRGILSLSVALEKKKKSFGARVLKKTLEVIVRVDEKGQIAGCASSGIDTTGASTIGAVPIEKVIKKSAAGIEMDDLDEKEIKKIIDNNEALKQMQEAINNMNKSNSEMDKVFKE
jgi:hypothetical protein